MWTTCTWIKRPYETSLFPEIGFGSFLRSLGGGQRRPPLLNTSFFTVLHTYTAGEIRVEGAHLGKGGGKV